MKLCSIPSTLLSRLYNSDVCLDDQALNREVFNLLSRDGRVICSFDVGALFPIGLTEHALVISDAMAS